MYKLAPSLLAADFGIIKEQLAKLDEAKVPYLHLDIMDGVLYLIYLSVLLLLSLFANIQKWFLMCI